MLKKLLCITLSALLLAGITLMNFNADSIISSEDDIVTKKDTITKYSYDPDFMPERADFETDEEYEKALSEYYDSIIQEDTDGIQTATANNNITATAQRKYTIKGLPVKNTIQNFHVSPKNIYTTQKSKNSSTGLLDVYISRCEISSDGKTAVCKDKMILRGFGHNQILTPYSHNGKVYLWIGCKPCLDFSDEQPTIQIGRIQYQAGKVYTKYTQICRFGGLNYANKNCTSIGAVRRVDAALSSDKSTLLIAVRSYDKETGDDKYIAYSCYNNTKLNQALDKVEADPSTNLVVFKDNTTLKNACLFTVIQPKKDAPLPRNSCQGLELTNTYYSIYISGGVWTKYPQIGKMVKSGNGYIYSSCVTLKNSFFTDRTEIEGLQIFGDYLYFAITGTNGPSTTQYIYSINKTIL